jgi:ligand-binding SRPBCC domain-containing protein
MKAGTRIDYTISLHGLPMKWRTRIDEYVPGVRFVDSQEKGPYKLWRHTHEFREENGHTVMRDRVEYQMPFGLLGELVHALAVKAQLRRIFAFREQVVSQLFA